MSILQVVLGPDLQNILRLSYNSAIITIDFLRYDSLAKFKVLCPQINLGLS